MVIKIVLVHNSCGMTTTIISNNMLQLLQLAPSVPDNLFRKAHFMHQVYPITLQSTARPNNIIHFNSILNDLRIHKVVPDSSIGSG